MKVDSIKMQIMQMDLWRMKKGVSDILKRYLMAFKRVFSRKYDKFWNIRNFDGQSISEFFFPF